MLIGLEGVHGSYVSIFGDVEHLRDFAPERFDTSSWGCNSSPGLGF
jgi:hypothetical protein